MADKETNEQAKAWLDIMCEPEPEGEEVWHAVASLDLAELPVLDKKFIKHLPVAGLVTQDYPKPNGTWRWFAHEIVEGKYPLELIPEHVRSLAKKLYYR